MLPVERACVPSSLAREDRHERVSAGVRQLPLIVSGAAFTVLKALDTDEGRAVGTLNQNGVFSFGLGQPPSLLPRELHEGMSYGERHSEPAIG